MRRDEQLDRELQFHLDERAAELVAAGVSRHDAERRARLEFGGHLQVKEAIRDHDGWFLLGGVLQDLRYALRTLRRDLGFATFAILIIGLGAGASSTIFSVVNALLIRPLPFHDPARLVWVTNQNT